VTDNRTQNSAAFSRLFFCRFNYSATLPLWK